ncbi:MAG TPA: hypothetical protein VEJ18_19570, partial [Planctomycetota bacterium]|nr:hypothetical protein [Planctomycetota bacterium]
TARTLLKDAEQLARLGKDAGLAARTAERAKDVADLAAEHEKFLKAESALAAQPLDPDASLVYGRYLCFVKGRWEKGAPYLARGADAALAEVAQKELVPQAFPEDQAALGDAWWSLAEKTKPAVDKKRYQRRGYEWYETALKSATGLARSRIQQRMQAMEKDLSPKGLVDLLRMIDVKKDAVTDAWTLQRSALVSPATAGPRLMIPYQPPDEYDLKIVAENRTPEVRGALFVGLVVADKQMAAGLDLLEGFTASCLEVAGPNETVHKGKVFVDDRPRTVLCSVRRAKVTVTVDGKTVLDWKVDPKRIVEAALPQKKSLWLGAHFGAFHVTQMTLVHVSGLGKPLR